MLGNKISGALDQDSFASFFHPFAVKAGVWGRVREGGRTQRGQTSRTGLPGKQPDDVLPRGWLCLCKVWTGGLLWYFKALWTWMQTTMHRACWRQRPTCSEQSYRPEHDCHLTCPHRNFWSEYPVRWVSVTDLVRLLTEPFSFIGPWAVQLPRTCPPTRKGLRLNERSIVAIWNS